VLPGDTQASHTAFISLKWRMSESQIVADNSFELSVPAAASNSSILRNTSSVCWRTSAAWVSATCPAR
jgi:hypothetical protein